MLVLAVAGGCSRSDTDEPVAELQRPAESDGASGVPAGEVWSETDLLEAIAAAGAAAGHVSEPGPLESCGLRPGGELVCWGRGSLPWQQPEGVFAVVSTGLVHGCGLRISGEVDCWGRANLFGETYAPEGKFASVSASRTQSCGLRLDGAVECWGGVGELLEGVEPPVADVGFPGGVFTAVSVGGAHVCGLRSGGEAACWGANWFGQADAPPGPFIAVDAGASHSCGLRSDGSVTCWGQDSLDAAELITSGYHFGGDEQAYAARQRDIANRQEFYEGFGFTGEYLGASAAALLDLQGAVPEVEAREEMARRAAGWEPPAGPFVAVSAGDGFTCGLRADGEAACWGYYAREEPRIPLEVYAAVYGERLRDFHDTVSAQVALGEDGFDPRFYPLYESLYGARVWELDPSQYLLVGYDMVPREPASAPSDDRRPPTHLIAAPEQIPVESMVAVLELTDPPPGPFVAVKAGMQRACGLRPDGEIECWGHQAEDTAPPAGTLRHHPDHRHGPGPVTQRMTTSAEAAGLAARRAQRPLRPLVGHPSRGSGAEDPQAAQGQLHAVGARAPSAHRQGAVRGDHGGPLSPGCRRARWTIWWPLWERSRASPSRRCRASVPVSTRVWEAIRSRRAATCNSSPTAK